VGLAGWIGKIGRNRRVMALVALLSTFAGVGLLIDRPKGFVLEWLAIPLLVAGAAVFAWAVWPRSAMPADNRQTLARKLLDAITFQGRLVPFFPAIGAAILVADLAFNLALSASPGIGTEDTIVLLLAGTLLAYGLIPKRFARERDFVLVFSLSLNAILVLPLLVARAALMDYERSVDAYSWVALAPQTSAVLSLLGVSNNVHAVPGSTAPALTFTPPNLGIAVTAVISTACSGLYSFGIFASAFVAFVLTEYERPTRRTWILLVLGFLAAYAANVLRMVIIVLVGYYTDTAQTDLQNMLIAHSYAGWIIFLGWVTLFWGILLKFLKPNSAPALVRPVGVGSDQTNGCRTCGGSLTPAIPATRCVCGAYYHLACASSKGRCLRCDSPVWTKPPPGSHT